MDTRDVILEAITGAFTTKPQLAECVPLNVYVYGSHLHGCAGPRSDYDFVVVVSAPAYFPGIRRVALLTILPAREGGDAGEEEVELDLNVYHEAYFRQLVEQNVVMVLTALFAPPEAVWLQRVDFRSAFAVRLPQLRVYITAFLNAKWRRAQHYWKQDKRDSKKIVATVLRYLLLALELAKEGAINNIALGNDYYHEIMGCEEDSWEYYQNKYRPLANALTKQLMGMSAIGQRLVSSETVIPPGVSPTTLALREYGLETVCTELSIANHRHSARPNLVLLISDAAVSPLNSAVVRECQGLVVDESAGWRPVCVPLHHAGSYWYEHWSEPAKKKKRDIKSKETEGVLYVSSSVMQWGQDMTVYDDLDGVEASLYHYEGEWLLSSRWSADASQPLLDVIDRRKGKHHNPFTFLEEQLQDSCEARICKETEERGKADGIVTVADLFWEIWKAKGHPLPTEAGKCFTFEVCSRRFPHIVRHGDDAALENGERIVLQSVRDLNTLDELEPQPFAAKYGWEVVNHMPLPDVLALVNDEISVPFWAREWVNQSDLGKRARRRHNKRMNRMRRQLQEEAQKGPTPGQEASGEDEKEEENDEEKEEKEENEPESVEEALQAKERNDREEREDIIHKLLYRSTKLDPVHVAGLVLKDRLNQRIKIESPQYRLLRNMFLAQQPTVKERQMVDFVRTNTHAGFLRYYPEWRALYEDVRERYDTLCTYVERMYVFVKDMDARPYHEWVKSNNEAVPSSLLYWLNGFRQDKVSDIRRLLAFCALDKLVVLLNQFEHEIRGTKPKAT